MSTHNICICREIRKILCGNPLLSVAMQSSLGLHVRRYNNGFTYIVVQQFFCYSLCS